MLQGWRFGLELQLLIRILLKGDGEELGVFFGVATEHLELLMERSRLEFQHFGVFVRLGFDFVSDSRSNLSDFCLGLKFCCKDFFEKFVKYFQGS